jgi:ABC-type lipoprotein export system ATPase subunit
MSEKVIEVEDLVKDYGGPEPVLNGISFSIGEGQFVTIYGKSGSGKTTLLNIIGGLDRPTSGRVSIDGQNIDALSEDELAHIRLSKIGFIFQDYNLLMDLTIRNNVGLPLRFSGRRDAGRVEEFLKKFDILHVADITANKVSGGEAQRAAIARALINEPKIILADEPTGNLDSENTDNVIRTLHMVMKEYGTTVLLATHDKDLADHADSRLFLSAGTAAYEILRP